ncbi:MAG: EFR1 family ferrodoxin [Bacteroidales bacterium]|nr:EFR1 family ferrodoxin [Bacteroidales bacterium]
MIFYFSGCGNSKFVALELAHRLNEKLIFIPDAVKKNEFEYHFSDNEMLGFVFPVYCWAPPQLVLDFISKLVIERKPSYTYFVTTYGDNAGYTDRVFEKALAEKGIDFSAGFGVQMPETYVNMAGMDVDKPEIAIQKVEKAKQKLPYIMDSIAERRHGISLEIGKHPFIKTYIVKPIFYKALVTDKKWWTTEDCVGCGSCASVCPLENISLNSQKKPQWNGNCTTCEACYHICPKNAIQFADATKGKGQFSRYC